MIAIRWAKLQAMMTVVVRCGLMCCGLMPFGSARADLLNPADYASQGVLNVAGSGVTLSIEQLQPNAAPYLYADGPSINRLVAYGYLVNGVAVFDFDSINIGQGQTLVSHIAMPFALLSRGDIIIAGTIAASGIGYTAGPGGYGGGVNGGGPYGPGTDSSGSYDGFAGTYGGAGSGGGGYGGAGGAGGGYVRTVSGNTTAFPGGAGGTTYGSLAQQLIGGSGGGWNGNGGTGGGGGGAVEVGALGGVNVSGSILVNGGGGTAGDYNGAGGGGAGGGILLHANTISLTGLLSADGGAGGNLLGGVGPGGGGGGGQILIEYGQGGISDSGTIQALGGMGGSFSESTADMTYVVSTSPAGDGANGQVSIIPLAVPEPTTLLLVSIGLGVALAARRVISLKPRPIA